MTASRDPEAMDWQGTQSQAYLDLLTERLREPRLTWVNQFVELINREIAGGLFGELETLSLHDYGCNVGHFRRGVGDIDGKVVYSGYDVSETYLAIARRHFAAEGFFLLDISSPEAGAHLQVSDVAVMSATLEHIDDYRTALRNVFSHTARLVILRTFVGPESLREKCRTVGARRDYLIRQFAIEDLTAIPAELGYSFRDEIDLATMGKSKMVCNSSSVSRRQTVLVFSRRGAS